MQATKEKGNNILISVFLLLSFPIYVFSQLSTLSVSISDENGLFTPVRARLTDSSGKTAPLPREAVSVMYGRDDRAEGYGFQPDSSFYVDGKFSIDLLPGNYRLSLSKGYEYLTQKHDILVKPGKNLSLNFHLQRWIDMPARGWYSADDHIHIRRSPRIWI